jgi:hypothetical protein
MSTWSVTRKTPPLEELDARLARSPFGNSDSIIEQLHLRYERRLANLTPHLPVAGQLLDALRQADAYSRYRVIGDTVVRCAVHYALTILETGTRHGLPLDLCVEVFRATIRHLEDGPCGPLGSRLVGRLGPDSHHGWIWSDDRRDDVFARSFRSLVQDHYGGPLCTPTTDEVDMLAKGARLLGELMPASSRSALSHAHMVAVFPPVGTWTGASSSSAFVLSGTIFLGRDGLSSPWWVAEHLLHEALHQQFYDFRHGHTLFDEKNLDRGGAPRVHAIWNPQDSKGGDRWSIFRALAAFHVYVYTAVLCRLAEARATAIEVDYGPLPGPFTMCGSRKAFERAHYLAGQIRASCWQELGPAGKRLVDWLCSALDVLDPSPPPRDCFK